MIDILPRPTSDMYESARYSWHLPHRPISYNMGQHIFFCIFSPKMLCFLFLLLTTAKTKVTPVSLPARVKQVWRGDYSHKPLSFPGSLVGLQDNRGRLLLGHCPLIKESKALPLQITPLTSPRSTIPSRQTQHLGDSAFADPLLSVGCGIEQIGIHSARCGAFCG